MQLNTIKKITITVPSDPRFDGDKKPRTANTIYTPDQISTPYYRSFRFFLPSVRAVIAIN